MHCNHMLHYAVFQPPPIHHSIWATFEGNLNANTCSILSHYSFSLQHIYGMSIHFTFGNLTKWMYRDDGLYRCLSMRKCSIGKIINWPTRDIHKLDMLAFYPAALKAPGYCRTPSGRAGGRTGGRAAGQTSPVNTLTSIIFHGSFSNLARTFIVLRSRTSSIMEVLPH